MTSRIDHDVMVPMRDGVKLATDIYHPADQDAAAPVLVYRTPYCKDEMARDFGFAEWFAEEGYRVVQQDCRGCYKSEGDLDFFRAEAADGYDTLKWIEAQPWGDADVGSWGTSWSGWTQTAMASMGPSRLKTMVPQMSGSDAYSSSVRQGGALELRWIAWAFWHSAENTQRGLNKSPATEEALLRPEKRFSDWLKAWPIRRDQTQLRLVPSYERWAFDLIEQEERSSYWEHIAFTPIKHMASLSQISALFIGSWYDSYARSSFESYLAHSRSGAGKTELLMGPWLHGTTTVSHAHAGGICFDNDAALSNYKQLLLDWFDQQLKSREPVRETPPIRLYVMGGGSGARDPNGRLHHGGTWRDEEAWPLARSTFQRFHLTPNGDLDPRMPNQDDKLSFVYDPEFPVPTLGGNVSSLSDVRLTALAPEAYYALPHLERITPLTPAGGFDQNQLGDRPDVLRFSTAPLAGPVEVTGPIVVVLWVSTDAADTDFTAKLIDVYPQSDDLPEGYALNLTDGIVRLGFRGGGELRQPVKAGQVYPIEIQLYPTSNLFVRGHRIRLDISSSNFPRFDRNPNTGEAPHLATKTVAAANTVHLGGEHPSHIVLPIIRRTKDGEVQVR